MEIVPCSRVAHLRRHHLPYRLPDQELLQRNKIRVAETWMDAYSKIFYRRDTLAHFIRQVCVCVSLSVCVVPEVKLFCFFICRKI